MEHVIIAGNGKTSRANLEALMSDYYQAEKNQVTLELYSEGELSDAQVWAKQQAVDLGIKVTESLHSKAVPASDSTSFFVLWADEDPLCQTIMSVAKSLDLRVFDLTNGLHELLASTEAKPYVAPEIPKDEKAEEPEPEPEVEEAPEDEDEDEDSDPLMEAVYDLVEALAEAVMARLYEKAKSE